MAISYIDLVLCLYNTIYSLVNIYTCDNIYVTTNGKEAKLLKLNNGEWILDDNEWVPFDQTQTYKNYIARKMKDKGNRSVNSAVQPREVNEMELEVHNKLDINYNKTLSAISFFTKAALGKFARKKEWKLEVWLEERNSKRNPTFSCGVALLRPKKSTIYAKKVSGNLNEALKRSVAVIEKSIRREEVRWRNDKIYQPTS
jgi:hypothetical protein